MSFFKSLFNRAPQPPEAMAKVIRTHSAFADASMLMVTMDGHDRDPDKQKIIALFQYGAIDAYSQMAKLDSRVTYDLIVAYFSNVSFCSDPRGMAQFVCDSQTDTECAQIINLGGQTATEFLRGNSAAAGRLHRFLFELDDH